MPKEKRISYDIITALTNFEKIVILGDPGSGKSTTLKYLAYTICAHRTDSYQLQAYIPIYIKATEYANIFQTKDEVCLNLLLILILNMDYYFQKV